MDSEYEVIVIGAGPGGASCAKTLVDNHVKTLVVERKLLPRMKSCCGLLEKNAAGFVDKKFGTIPEDILCRNSTVNFLWSATGINYNHVNGFEAFLNVKRDEFDFWLIKTSRSNFIDNCNVIDIVSNEKESNISVLCIHAGKEKIFKAKHVVCACGANSIFRKKFDKNFTPKDIGFSIQKIYTGEINVDKNNYFAVVNKKYTDTGYSYYLVKDDFLHIGIGWIGKYNNYYENWYGYVKNRNKGNLQVVRDERCCIANPLQKNSYFYGTNQILFVGESAGLIGKWGIGITSALISGENAGNAIVRAKNIISEYQKNMEGEIAKLFGNVQSMLLI